MNPLKAIGKKLKAAREATTQEAKAILEPTLKEFLRDHPSVLALAWTQYAPHFNDGDACTFSVHEVRVRMVDTSKNVNDDGEVEEEFDPETSSYYVHYVAGYLLKGKLQSDLRDLNDGLSAIEDSLEQIYGDGVMVVVTRDETFVVEHEHD